MKIGWITKLILGKDVVELIYDYIRFRGDKSEGGRKLTDTEKKHLKSIATRIGLTILSKFLKGIKDELD